jgi:short-subunit dehydrogenase
MGVPIRTLYSAPKFAMDGFGKALEPEVRKHGIKVTQIYPAYIHTNISMNAATGSGKAFGMTDENIKAGIPVDVAVDNILKAIYLKRS